MKRIVLVFFIFSLVLQLDAQPYTLSLKPLSVPNLGGLQSYAFGQSNGKWLLIGGRLDGLHRRQPWASFDQAGHNNQLWVIDPVAGISYSAPLTALPTSAQEQLSSTNMEFYQREGILYVVGGYGYSATAADHTTFPYMCAIDVDAAIQAVIQGGSLQAHIRQISDPLFQVTGGHLDKIGSDFYLLGGQKFIGRYNPMGPTHGPGFIQEYSNSIRVFSIQDDGSNVSVQWKQTYTDAAELHRRDYNAEVQIKADGSEGITMFSGVFQPTVNLPFLNNVDVDSLGYYPNASFQQKFNHYHCPVIPMYSNETKEMHNLFFGGIAQFYMDGGQIIQDDDVPFVRSISLVKRDSLGNMSEVLMPIQMPNYLGASAEFIPNEELKSFSNGVFKLDSLSSDSSLLGHIFGGINSSDKNIFFINDGTQSSASQVIYEVWLTPSALGIGESQIKNKAKNIRIVPNPNHGNFDVEIGKAPLNGMVEWAVYSNDGKSVQSGVEDVNSLGENRFSVRLKESLAKGAYQLRVQSDDINATSSFFIE